MWILFQGCISKMQLAYIQTVYAIQYMYLLVKVPDGAAEEAVWGGPSQWCESHQRKPFWPRQVMIVMVEHVPLIMMMIVEKKMMIARMNQACRRVLLPSTCGWDFAHQVLEILEVLIFCSWTCLFHRLLLMSMCQYLRQQCFVLFWSHPSPY